MADNDEEQKAKTSNNVRDLVVPVTLLAGMFGVIFGCGVLYQRVNYIESDLQKSGATLSRVCETLQQLQRADDGQVARQVAIEEAIKRVADQLDRNSHSGKG